jgi:UDP-N-acetylglucosamine acyltransferase
MAIHPTALVDPKAQLGQDVEILPFTIIEASAVVGDRCTIGPSAAVRKWTSVGSDCIISSGVVLGEPPQDRKYQGEESYLTIGNGNQIREYVTLHRASGEGNSTSIGDNNMIMAYCHAGHNVTIGSNISIANGCQLAGHSVIEDYANIGGMCGFHQNVTIGTMSMVGAMSRISRDVPPYSIVEGNPAEVHGLNVIGLERRGVSADSRAGLRKAFRLLFRSEYNVSDALQAVEAQVETSDELEYLLAYIRRVQQGTMGRQRSHR